jgi:RHS repeat-associated protein
LFTGRYYDAETGLYYYRARVYNPYIGRFMQTDPSGYKGGINLYAYCGNNPIMLVDPYGLCGGGYDYLSAFKGSGRDFATAFSDGINITSNNVTFNMLEGKGIPGWVDSGTAMARTGTAGQISQYLSYTGGGAGAAASGLVYLGLDLTISVGTTAASNPETQNTLRALSERITDFKTNPQNWLRMSASAEQARVKGGVSIESVYTNTKTGETLNVHDVFTAIGNQIDNHPTFRDYGK